MQRPSLRVQRRMNVAGEYYSNITMAVVGLGTRAEVTRIAQPAIGDAAEGAGMTRPRARSAS
jgi:hypothetical protein